MPGESAAWSVQEIGIRTGRQEDDGRLAGKKSGGWYRRSLGINMKVTEGRVRLATSDVANFLACQRLTQLDLLRARGELRPPRAAPACTSTTTTITSPRRPAISPNSTEPARRRWAR